MHGRLFSHLILAGAALLAAPAAARVDFDWVYVGDPGNAHGGSCASGPIQTCGVVNYGYYLSAYEVTNGQYAEFLNAKAASDPHGLYDPQMKSDESRGGITRVGVDGSFMYVVKPGFAEKPVVYVSFWDAVRFANWVHNGQGSGDTETGAYTLTPEAIASNTVVRSPEAAVAVPSEDEWYKAAYYDGAAATYFDHPAGTNAPTDCAPPEFDSGNAANCWPATSPQGAPTDVGAYGLSASPYGTFDQGGNVAEWNETIVGGSLRGIRGGSFAGDASELAASSSDADCPSCGFDSVGFRIVARAPVLAACSDGIDNDGDGLVDHPDDPGCQSPTSARENPKCQDGIDNDGDGRVDFDGGLAVNGGVPLAAPDPQCRNPWQIRETGGCGLGGELVVGWAALRALARRRARRPNA